MRGFVMLELSGHLGAITDDPVVTLLRPGFLTILEGLGDDPVIARQSIGGPGPGAP